MLSGFGGLLFFLSPHFLAMAVYYHLPRTILAHQKIVVLQLHSGLSHHVARVIELPLRLVEHVFAHFADITDDMRHESIARIKPPMSHDSVQFR